MLKRDVGFRAKRTEIDRGWRMEKSRWTSGQPGLREAPPDALQSFITPTSQHFVLAALGIPRPGPPNGR